MHIDLIAELSGLSITEISAIKAQMSGQGDIGEFSVMPMFA